MRIPVTLLYGGLTALMVTLLGANVSRLRIAHKAGVTDPLPRELVRPVRAHANAAEWVPLGLVLLLALEAAGPRSPLALHLAGGTFFLARALHAAGVYTRTPLSTVGAALNYVVLGAMSVWALAQRLPG